MLPVCAHCYIIGTVDIGELIPIILAILTAVALPIALSLRKKGGRKKAEELHQHLLGIGLKVSPIEKESEEEIGLPKHSWGDKSEGAISVEGRKIDYIRIIGVSSQYGTNYYIEYLLKTPGIAGREDMKKTSMVKKKSPPLWGKAVDIEWKGNPSLSQRLNFDYQLKYRLLNAYPKPLKGGISIHPEPRYGYTRIRTSYQLPSPDLFEAMDTIAKHVKVGV
ncbi:MAG TPA: hypothetical protein G4O13_02730 [Dehalococcoidia bacterium]|nr:hypothetical protein [Dehalococcoidia bacterium]